MLILVWIPLLILAAAVAGFILQGRGDR